MVEGTFPSGTYLVTVHHPVSTEDGDLEKALYGSFLPIPSKDLFPASKPEDFDSKKMPGAVIPAKEGDIAIKEGRKRIRLKVVSKGDRPIQVHFPLSSGKCQKASHRTYRLDPITILLKPTPSLNLIVSRHMDTFSTSRQVRPCDSSLVIRRR